MKKRLLAYGSIILVLLLLIAAFFLLNPHCYGCQFTESGDNIVYLRNGDIHLCYNNFPDDTFREFVARTLNSREGDAVPAEQFHAVSELDCSGLGIADITGIHLFSNLKVLNCSNNQLTELFAYEYAYREGTTAAELPLLESLDCSHNQIGRLDLYTAQSLHTLKCSHNGMSYLTIPKSGLLYVDCSHNELHLSWLIDKFENHPLTYLDFGYNAFSYYKFDRSDVPSLKTLITEPQSKYVSCNHDYQNGFLFIPGRCIYCGETESKSVHEMVRLIALPLCTAGAICAVIYVRRRNKQIKDWENKDTNRTHEDPQTYTN